MSKLEELLQQYCPNGVEYKTVGEIATDIFRGSGITRDQVTETGTPCVRYGEIYTTYGVWFDTCVSHTDVSQIASPKWFGHGDILFAITGEKIDEIAKSCAYVGHDKCLAGGDTVVLQHKQNPKYLAYALSTTIAQEQKSKGKVKNKVVHSSVPSIKEIILPIPPLSVQDEIVRILDIFTELDKTFGAELEAELLRRRQQFEYYKGLILDFSDRDMIALSELFNTRNGFTPSKANSSFWEDGIISWFRMEDIRLNGRILSDAMQHITMDAVKNKPFPADSIIVSTSATIGEHALITVPFLSNQRFTCLTLKEKYKNDYDIKFLYYYCFKLDEYCLQNLNQGNFSSVDMAKFGKFTFPVISLEEQRRVVSLLDRYDDLCAEVSNSLVAEIAARQKQYEYYRDKLLSFEPVKEV